MTHRLRREKVKIALIATGDEVVSGQIVNTNTSELAKVLTKEGAVVLAHFAVVDSADDLKKTLEFIKSNLKINTVFTIGGLGPTRDDLTRNVVSEFLNSDLVLDVPLWDKLKANLMERGITPQEGHKWQCYFSKASKVFKNSKGTAHGFLTEKDDFSIVCLPGPPQEMNSVLENGLLEWIKSKTKPGLKLYTWQCINTPESELAHKVETALKGCDYQLGFRAYPPITEVKLWIPQNTNFKEDIWIKKVFEVCKDTLYSTQEKSYIKEVIDFLASGGLRQGKKDVYFLDSVTNGESLDEIKRAYHGKIPQFLKYGYGPELSLKSESCQKLTFLKTEIAYQLKTPEHSVELELHEANCFRTKRADMFALYVLSKKLFHLGNNL